MYAWLLYGHLLGVGLLVAGTAVYIGGVAGLRRARTVDELRTFSALTRLGERLLIPGALTLLVFGLTLAARYWSLTEGWILAAIGLVVAQGIIGSAVTEPVLRRLRVALDHNPTPEPAKVIALARAPTLHAGSRIAIVILVELELLMTIKPGSRLLLLTLLATLILAIALAAPVYRDRSSARSARGTSSAR